MEKDDFGSSDRRAWTLATVTWLLGAAGFYFLDWLIGGARDQGARQLLAMGLYALAFFYFLALGPLHDFFLRRLDAKTPKA